jgi:alpha-tubulin suppressor-like RCC1 family protein
VEVVAGVHNTCGRLEDGTVRCWGRNDFGELGNGKADPGTSVPDTRIFGLKGVTRLTTGDHACAFDGDGALRCWGRNDYGQLGFSSAGNSVLKPTVVPF